MNKDEALKLALKALEWDADYDTSVTLQKAAITAIKQALAAQPAFKPLTDEQIWNVAEHCEDDNRFAFARAIEAAAQRQWVWLSKEDEQEIKDNCTTVACVLKAVKAKLKEKNT